MERLDFRVEASYTNLPGLIQTPEGGFFYWNDRYLDGYTNKGNIIGDATVGRQGISLRASTTYWAAPTKRSSSATAVKSLTACFSREEISGTYTPSLNGP